MNDDRADALAGEWRKKSDADRLGRAKERLSAALRLNLPDDVISAAALSLDGDVKVLAFDEDGLYVVVVAPSAAAGHEPVTITRRPLGADRVTIELLDDRTSSSSSETVSSRERQWTFTWPDGFELRFAGVIEYISRSPFDEGDLPTPTDPFAVALAAQLGWQMTSPATRASSR